MPKPLGSQMMRNHLYPNFGEFMESQGMWKSAPAYLADAISSLKASKMMTVETALADPKMSSEEVWKQIGAIILEVERVAKLYHPNQ